MKYDSEDYNVNNVEMLIIYFSDIKNSNLTSQIIYTGFSQEYFFLVI